LSRHLGWRLAAVLALLGAAAALLATFALALLVGIVVGTYSSVFVATPLVVAFEGRRRAPPTPRPAQPGRPREAGQVRQPGRPRGAGNVRRGAYTGTPSGGDR